MFYSSRRKCRKTFNHQDLDVLEATPEQFRIKVDTIIRNFIADTSARDYSFDATLSNLERKYIHQKAQLSNMTSRSHGKDPNRILTIYKKQKETNFESFFINFSPDTVAKLTHFTHVHRDSPLAPRSITKLPGVEKVFGKLVLGRPPLVAAPLITADIARFQRMLPVFELRSQLIEKVRTNQVLIVSSETGSGKTTQIPQYIMDDARARNEPCRIICTQPRRISAVSVAARVSAERGSKLGEAVGYHIRLQSKLGTKSNLIYCTNGVLIRSLMLGDEVLSSLTHIIVDEVHERDKLSDFLLICLRQFLRNGKPIKIVLMSATIDVAKFQAYFGRADVISIPGRLFKIKEYFLDDVLGLTNYQRDITATTTTNSNNWSGHNSRDLRCQERISSSANSYFDQVIMRYSQLNEIGDDNGEAWSNLLQCISNDEMNVNYQHSENGYTALMVAVEKGCVSEVEQLCNLGASASLETPWGVSAKKLAEMNKHDDILLLLNHTSSSSSKQNYSCDMLLEHYLKVVNEDEIDFDLMIKLISTIHTDYHNGAILVFLPGYDDIMICHDRLLESDLNPSTYKVFFLHGSMDINEQHGVFSHLPNKRKIILSTNIAETSLTIDDVLYVINTGKSKQQIYDTISGLSSLQVQWISQACVKQRAGRAGRTSAGICFHMFSRSRHSFFLPERTPEILRVPLEELCLNTKSLAGNIRSIYGFLELAPDPPSTAAVKMAINNLIRLGALDESENLTSLGEYLSQLTIEPHLGKMLIYSVIFRCLDPILTIVASLAQKDPFQLPPQANLRTCAAEKRKSLNDNSLSDHLIYLKAFIKWQEATLNHRQNSFCKEYFISKSTMDTVLKTRCQLLGQLRAAKFVPSRKFIMRELNTFSENWPLIKAVIASGLYPKFAYKKLRYFYTRTEDKIGIHHSSTLSKENIDSWLIFDEMMKFQHNSQIRGVTPITPLTVTLICGNHSTNPRANYLIIDDWLEFEFPNNNLIVLRKAIEKIIATALLNPLNSLNDGDVKALETFADILFIEDVVANMGQPRGIRNKPKFFDFNFQQQITTTMNNNYNNCNEDNDDDDFNPVQTNRFSEHRETLRGHHRQTSSTTLSTTSSSSSSSMMMINSNNTNNINGFSGGVKNNHQQQLSPFHRTLDDISRNSNSSNNMMMIQQQQSVENQLNNMSINQNIENIGYQNNYYSSGSAATINQNGKLENTTTTTNNNYNNSSAVIYNNYYCSSSNSSPSVCQQQQQQSSIVVDNLHDNDDNNTETVYSSSSSSSSGSSSTTSLQQFDDEPYVYLLLKAEEKSVKIAYTVREWKFSPQTEKLIIQYCNMGKKVYLLFSDSCKQMFYGIAELTCLCQRGNVNRAKISWIFQIEFPFAKTRKLRNPYRSFRLIYDAPDGQRIPTAVMGQLNCLFAEHFNHTTE